MSAIDTAIDWLNTQVSNAGNAIESVTDEWNQKVNELKAKAYEFTQLYNQVKLKASKLPADSPARKEAQETLATADRAKAAVEAVTRTIDSVASFSLPWFGKQAMDGVFLAPIPIAVVAGAITLLGTQLISLRKLDERLDHEQFLIDKGADPNIVAKQGGSKPFIDLGLNTPVLLLTGGAALYLMWPTIKKKFNL